MNRPGRCLFPLTLLIVASLHVLLAQPPVVALPPDPPTIQDRDRPPPPNPLGRRCGGTTPPGAPLSVCCIWGVVYIDGEIVANAQVEITNASQEKITTFTRAYSGTVRQPYYKINLSAPPLTVRPGDTITVTTRYSSHERTRTYVVQPGSQQLDVVLPRNQALDYVFDRYIVRPTEPATFDILQDVAVDSQGNVYVIDVINTRVRVFSSNGTFLRQWGTPGSEAGQFLQPTAITTDASDNVYVVDSVNDTIQKFTSTGEWLLMWGSSGQGAGQFLAPWGIAIDSRGNVYVTDTGNDRVEKFTSTGEHLLSWGGGGVADGQFNDPWDIVVDNDGFVYVTDYRNNRIQKFTSDGEWQATWDRPGTDREAFDRPAGLALGSDSTLYIADSLNNRIHQFTTDGQWRMSWGDAGSDREQIREPWGLALDSDNQIYVTDTLNDRIQKFTAAGEHQATWGSSANQEEQPILGIVFAADGTLFIADEGNHRLQRYHPTNGLLATWGEEGSGNGQFDTPRGLAIDSSGNLYVADSGNHRIQQFRPDGTHLATWGEEGSGDGQFDTPRGLAIDSSGNLYVADSGNHRIQQFRPDGTHLATWGEAGRDNGQFNQPRGLATSSNGDLYVVDSRNNRIQQFNSSGGWLASWGEPDSSGTSIVGELQEPTGIAVNARGNIAVVSNGSSRIQIFRPMETTRPVATITHLSATSLGDGDTLVLRGLGQDSDEAPDITDYRWTSDRDGNLGTSATLTLPASALSAGTHEITLEVRNNNGEWSRPVSQRIFVAEPAQNRHPWTMLLYLAGDFNDEEQQLRAFNETLDELRASFRNPHVRIAVQIDGPARGGGDTRRLLFTPGTATTPPEVTEQTIPEQRMDDPDTLADFVRWGQEQFPAEHYYLVIANHGQALLGTAWDMTSNPNQEAYLTARELGDALNATGVAPVDIVHLDSCSMNLLEVAYEVRERTRVLIASQYLGWDYFAYHQYQQVIEDDSSDEEEDDFAPHEVAEDIIEEYEARASADEVPFTIAALNMERGEPMLAAVDALAAELAALVANGQISLDTLQGIWEESQKFDSNGDFLNNNLDMYIDLTHWASLIQIRVTSPAVKGRAAELIEELTGQQPFIIESVAESHELPPAYGAPFIELQNSNGLSIFYPERRDTQEYLAYIDNQLFRFTADSRWVDFLQAGRNRPEATDESVLPPLPPVAVDTPGPERYRVFIPLLVR